MRRTCISVAICAVAFSLTACGGGGGSAPHPQTPPPPPPPPTTSSASLPLTTSGTFSTATATRTEHTGPAPNIIAVTSQSTTSMGSALTITYNAADGTYALQQAGANVSFSAADRTGTGGSLDNYSKQNGNLADQLSLYNNVRSGASTAGAPISLSYLSYGNWSHFDSQSGDGQRTFFLFGYPTATASMPRTGSASYQTYVTGSMRRIESTVDGVTEHPISGSATFNADFAAGNVVTNLALVDHQQQSLGSYSGTGTISANQFSGSFTSNVTYFAGGSFTGGFFGPAASEMGFGFEVRRTFNGDPYAGAALNFSNEAIVGAVIGKKN